MIQAERASALASEPLTAGDPAEVAGYRLHARLGAGGMGRVYLASTPGGRPVALKVIRPEYGDDEDFRRRFRQEIQAARRVHGLYTAQVLDADPDATPSWLVTAYVPGPSLQQAVTEHGALPAETVLLLMAGVAEALQAIHAAGIVHRDLKPSNVLLAHDGPRVIDFGIARAAEATAVTRSGIRVGSPQFMAPEQILDQPVSPAIDMFALGSLAAFAALGRAPFGEGSEAAVLYRVLHEPADLTGCPAHLRILIERCLAKEPAARPAPAEVIQSCRAQTAGRTMDLAQSWLPSALAAAMAHHAAQSPAADAPTGAKTLEAGDPPDRGRWRFSRSTMIVGLAAAVLLAALVGVTLLALRGSPRQRGGQALAAAASPRQARGTDLHATASRSPSPSPTAAAGVDSCLVGSWTETADDLINKIYNVSVQFTGRGAEQSFTADGRSVNNYGKGTLFTATINGVRWTDVFRGMATMHYQAQHGMLLISQISPHGSWALLDNGVTNNSGPLSIDPAPERYTCSGNVLREYANNDSTVLTRRQPRRQLSPDQIARSPGAQ